MHRGAPLRWSIVDETYSKVAGEWVYLYRAVDQHGQVIDACYPCGATWRSHPPNFSRERASPD
jgi:hypothetical protein